MRLAPCQMIEIVAVGNSGDSLLIVAVGIHRIRKTVPGTP
jgi:hypothetical protein